MASPRKKSPRAPSIALDEAIDRVNKVYGKERRHAVPTDVVAQDLGYKSANNGAALSMLASLRYYGLLERPKDGHLAVSKEFESYTYAPNESMRAKILHQWLRTPPIFAEMLDKYAEHLPSDATLRYDLIQQGFTPAGAESFIQVFRRSVSFAGTPAEVEDGSPNVEVRSEDSSQPIAQAVPVVDPAVNTQRQGDPPTMAELVTAPNSIPDTAGMDQIPVRLGRGRRAWLVVPQPFYNADKERLKAQIDLLLADDDEG